LHGWNFIGGANGEDVHFDTFEVTRQYAACHVAAARSGTPAIPNASRCRQIDADYEKQKRDIQGNVDNYRQASQIFEQIVPILKAASGAPNEPLTHARAPAI